MRTARQLALGIAVTVAAFAMPAAAAHAQESPVEAVQEPGGDPCDPCLIHVEGESSLLRPDGVRISTCSDEFVASAYHNATGESEWTGSSEGAPGCNATNCSSPQNHWDGYDGGETSAGSGHMTLGFCVGGLSCTAEGTVGLLGGHDAAAAGHQRCPHPVLGYVEAIGSWATENDGSYDNVEIVHP